MVKLRKESVMRLVSSTLRSIDGVSKGRQLNDVRRLHTFPARMPLHVAETLISELTHVDDIVLDPMVGSGTTVLAAKNLARVGIGFDLDPLAVIIARASTMEIEPQKLQRASERVVARAIDEVVDVRKEYDLLIAGLDDDDRDFIHYWFPKRCRIELFALSRAIEMERDRELRLFLWAVFSSLVIVKSSGPSYALDLAHSRPHKDKTKTILHPFKLWPIRLRKAISALGKFQSNLYGRVSVDQADARKIPLKASSVDFVLTSPPYLNAIDYMRAHKFSLVWMGKSLADLREIRGLSIGTQRGLKELDGLPDDVENVISDIENKAHQARVRRYLSDMHNVFGELHRVLKPGSLAIIAVGPSVISKARYDAIEILERLAKSKKLSLVNAVLRKLNVKRRALPAPKTLAGTNPLNKRMCSEALIALHKSD